MPDLKVHRLTAGSLVLVGHMGVFFQALFFFFFLNIIFYLFYFFLWLRWVFVAARGLSLVAVSGGATLCCSARASPCGGLSCCGAWALGVQASIVVERGLSSCGSRALERRLSSCGARA